jgi:hypothetical protein
VPFAKKAAAARRIMALLIRPPDDHGKQRVAEFVFQLPPDHLFICRFHCLLWMNPSAGTGYAA